MIWHRTLLVLSISGGLAAAIVMAPTRCLAEPMPPVFVKTGMGVGVYPTLEANPRLLVDVALGAGMYVELARRPRQCDVGIRFVPSAGYTFASGRKDGEHFITAGLGVDLAFLPRDWPVTVGPFVSFVYGISQDSLGVRSGIRTEIFVFAELELAHELQRIDDEDLHSFRAILSVSWPWVFVVPIVLEAGMPM